MSDLNELIASNAVRAYNEGLERGEAFERDRIIKILEENKMHYGCARDCPQPCDAPSFLEFIALIRGEQK